MVMQVQSEDLKIIGPEARRQVTQPWSKRSTRQDKAGDDGQSRGKHACRKRTFRSGRSVGIGALMTACGQESIGAGARKACRHCTSERKSFAGGCQRRCFGFEVAILRRNEWSRAEQYCILPARELSFRPLAPVALVTWSRQRRLEAT